MYMTFGAQPGCVRGEHGELRSSTIDLGLRYDVQGVRLGSRGRRPAELRRIGMRMLPVKCLNPVHGILR